MRRFTVRALTAELERLLARSFPRIVVEGELSQVSTPSSGHAYLTLRDAAMRETSICGLGMAAAAPLTTAMRFFPEEFEGLHDG